MTKQTPCQAGNAEDWFIDRDGRQYVDDGSLEPSPEEVRARAERLASKRGEEVGEEHLTRAHLQLRDANKQAALIRRRMAKQACHTTCPVRTQCLSVALDTRPQYGTWGGYYPEELGKIYAEIDRRRGR